MQRLILTCGLAAVVAAVVGCGAAEAPDRGTGPTAAVPPEAVGGDAAFAEPLDEAPPVAAFAPPGAAPSPDAAPAPAEPAVALRMLPEEGLGAASGEGTTAPVWPGIGEALEAAPPETPDVAMPSLETPLLAPDAAGEPGPSPGGAASPSSLAPAPRGGVERSASTEWEEVDVFYASNRARLGEEPYGVTATARIFGAPAAAALITLAASLAALVFPGRRRLLGYVAAAGAPAMLGLAAWAMIVSAPQQQERRTQGVVYGGERGELELGVCRVTIPPRHREGELETPSVFRFEFQEDPLAHVVLQETSPLADEEFYRRLADQVAASPRQEAFLFVHGYNVSFSDAARRTAQIAHDVEFEGAPVMFSWPSQAGLLKYTVDENNVAWAKSDLRQFLIDLSRRSGARVIHLIAHSMGGRCLTEALRELALAPPEPPVQFHQVLLAAPDVDAAVFRRDLAPALTKAARYVTLYASSRDVALRASKRVHGYPRAGDSGRDLVVAEGVETVDVSEADRGLLGHNYYGDNEAILADLFAALRDAPTAYARPWLTRREKNGQSYWIFEADRAAELAGTRGGGMWR